MFCENCGKSIPDTASTCPYCGLSTGVSPAPARPVVANVASPVASPVRKPGGAPMRDFLLFRRMITPVIIQICFWLGVAACVVVGLVMIFTAAKASPAWGQSQDTAAALQTLGGLALVVLGPLVCRIYSEILILLFRMNETLTEIKNGLTRAANPS